MSNSTQHSVFSLAFPDNPTFESFYSCWLFLLKGTFLLLFVFLILSGQNCTSSFKEYVALCTIFTEWPPLYKDILVLLWIPADSLCLHIYILLCGFVWKRNMVMPLHSLQIQHWISLWNPADAEKLNTAELYRQWMICKFIWNAHRHPFPNWGTLCDMLHWFSCMSHHVGFVCLIMQC